MKKIIYVLLMSAMFNINTMGDYHDLYLRTDILFLADAFEKFINTCLEYYGWYPRYYLAVLD